MEPKRTDLSILLDALPLIVPRCEIDRYLGGLIKKSYLQNLDSINQGPRRVKLGKRVGYLKQDLVEWLESRATIFEPSESSER